MRHRPTVILLAGPAGSGKTTVAARIAENPHWVHVSEDEYWMKLKAGRPSGELRTTEEQDIVQPQVIQRVFEVLATNENAVLEFILYEDPPRPLLRYQQALAAKGVAFTTTILRPSAEETLRRIQGRRRANDMHHQGLRANAELQMRVLGSKHIDAAWLIDTTDLGVEDVYDKYFKPLVDG